MENSKTLRESAAKVTSYQDFLLKMKDPKNAKKTAKPNNPDKQPQNIKPDAKRDTKNITKCFTQIPEDFSKVYQSVSINHQICRQSNTLINPLFSVQNFHDYDSSHNKQNLNTQRKQNGCSKSKCRNTYDNLQSQQQQKVNHYSRTITDHSTSNYLMTQILLIIQSLPKLNREKITYLDFLQILRELNMIQSNYEPNKDDCTHKLWSIMTIHNKENNTTPLVNFVIVMLAVMNVRIGVKEIKEFFECVSHPNKYNSTKKTKLDRGSLEFKKSKQGYFQLSKQEIIHIYNTFKELRVNRMHLGRINKKTEIIQEKSLSYSKCSFRPEISEKSKSLAKLKRQKQMFNQSSIMNFHELEQLKTERQKKQFQECTFQPNTSRDHNQSIFAEKELGIKRSQILYKLAKSKSKQKRDKKDRKQDQIQLERNQEKYTFKPKLRVYKKNLEQAKKSEDQIKQVDRMMRARLEREAKQKAQSKGHTFNQKSVNNLKRKVAEQIMIKNAKIQSQAAEVQQRIIEQKQQKRQKQNKQQTKKQIFTFEIYLQQNTKCDKITIYEGDNIEEVAHKFIVEHNLKPVMEERLVTSLKTHLQELEKQDNLCKIDEESIEYSIQM